METDKSVQQAQDDPDRLRRLVDGYAVSRAVHVVAALGIVDHLLPGPATVEALAAATGSHGPTLARLLRALCTVGLFREEDDGRFSVTRLGEGLREGSPLKTWAAWLARPSTWGMWGELEASVRTGGAAFPVANGAGIWDHYASHPVDGEAFNRAMTGNSRANAEAILRAYDFTPFRLIVDVAGGQGSFLAAVLGASPSSRGIVFDQPHVVPGTQKALAAAGLATRCEAVGGDFFSGVPTGGDAYVLKSILHDWDDADALRILAACRRAMSPAGRLLIIERVLSKETPELGRFRDLLMLVMYGGLERSQPEFERLLVGAGFRLTRIAPTGNALDQCVIEAAPQ